MTQVRNVAVLVGSLRKDSASRKVAKTITELSPSNLRYTFVEIGDLPFYDEDVEAAPPAAWTAFRERITAADAVLFVTPEYNRSVPGALKNAIDVGSRPYGRSVWNGKPAAVVSTSMGSLAGFGANHHLRQSLAFLNMPALQQPEAYIGDSLSLYDEEGRLMRESTAEFLKGFAQAFAAWIERQLGSDGARAAA